MIRGEGLCVMPRKRTQKTKTKREKCGFYKKFITIVHKTHLFLWPPKITVSKK